MSKIVAIALVIIALVMCGCTAQAPEAQKTGGPVATTGQAVHADPPAIAATPTQFIQATKLINGKKIPLIYERNGHYYPQPEGFVCTESNPQWMLFGPKDNYTYDPQTNHEAIWCER